MESCQEELRTAEEIVAGLKEALFGKSDTVSVDALKKYALSIRDRGAKLFVDNLDGESETANLVWTATLIAIQETIADKLRKMIAAPNN